MGKIRRKTLDRVIGILLVLAALVAVLLGIAVRQYLSGQQAPDRTGQSEGIPSAGETPKETALYLPLDGTLTREDGSRITLSALRGKPVLLVFWSSWCPDCKGFLQEDITDVFAAVRARGGEAFLVCREGRRGETWETARQALSDMQVAEPSLMDEKSAIYEATGLNEVPSMALLDARGRMMVAVTAMPDPAEINEMLMLLELGHQAYTERFLRSALLQPGGAVASQYGAQGSRVVSGQDVLSETQGLLMLYAVQAGDQALFDQAFAYVRNEMTVSGLTAWIVSSGEQGRVNAALDDLRILEALSLAEERWGGYRQELAYRESALYRRNVQGGHMRDYVNLHQTEPTRTVTLCYLDIAAMERLAGNFPKWSAVAKNAREVLSGGVISAEFPLFYPNYDPVKGQYGGEQLQMNEALVAVCNAARAGLDCQAAFDWLEEQMLSGGIFARYDLNGRPVRGYVYESTATYGLLVQAALSAGRTELARMALARMERTRCFTAPMAGNMGAVSDQTHYTFDLMQTLLAWQQWNINMK